MSGFLGDFHLWTLEGFLGNFLLWTLGLWALGLWILGNFHLWTANFHLWTLGGLHFQQIQILSILVKNKLLTSKISQIKEQVHHHFVFFDTAVHKMALLILF